MKTVQTLVKNWESHYGNISKDRVLVENADNGYELVFDGMVKDLPFNVNSMTVETSAPLSSMYRIVVNNVKQAEPKPNIYSQSYKGRNVSKGDMVSVYFNLHKHLFSIKSDRLVKAHGNGFMLQNVTFRVLESGRQRVLVEKKKNVHAFVDGAFHGLADGADVVTWLATGSVREATYNPYKYSSFVDKQTEMPLQGADMVLLIDKRMYYVGGKFK